mmetsp:Transcript_20434/g.69110  ORF Transcript_20434/g.69110 Transcript_20434/m.69110 type:complete len:240 (+) Transcript_20434:745-1464(+)
MAGGLLQRLLGDDEVALDLRDELAGHGRHVEDLAHGRDGVVKGLLSRVRPQGRVLARDGREEGADAVGVQLGAAIALDLAFALVAGSPALVDVGLVLAEGPEVRVLTAAFAHRRPLPHGVVVPGVLGEGAAPVRKDEVRARLGHLRVARVRVPIRAGHDRDAFVRLFVLGPDRVEDRGDAACADDAVLEAHGEHEFERALVHGHDLLRGRLERVLDAAVFVGGGESTRRRESKLGQHAD